MLFSCPCKAGQLQVDETHVQVMAPFKRLVWQVERAQLKRITQQSGAMMGTLFFHTATGGSFAAEMVAKNNAEKLLALFPDLAASPASHGGPWYLDESRLTYVATYTKEKDMQKEVEAAGQCGWMPQGAAGTAGHINVGRTAAKVVLLGPISLVTGASRSKDKMTITFVRTPEWLAEHQK